MSFSFSSNAALRDPAGKGALSSPGFPSGLLMGPGACCARDFLCRKNIGEMVIPIPQNRCKNLRRSWPATIILGLLSCDLRARRSAGANSLCAVPMLYSPSCKVYAQYLDFYALV